MLASGYEDAKPSRETFRGPAAPGRMGLQKKIAA